jgi:RND family efflux transporter MFP subunit
MVGEIPVKVGGYVQPLTQLLTITDNKSLELNLDLPAEYLARMKLGLPLEIVQDGKVIATAPVSFIAPNVSVETQTVLIKAIFPNKDNLLRADQSVHTRLVWAKKQGILVPVTSVLHLGGKDFVYFLEKDEKAPMGWVAKQHPIELGSIQGDSYVVLKGIKPGIQLITAGIQKLMDGAPVMLPGQFPSKEKK